MHTLKNECYSTRLFIFAKKTFWLGGLSQSPFLLCKDIVSLQSPSVLGEGLPALLLRGCSICRFPLADLIIRLSELMDRDTDVKAVSTRVLIKREVFQMHRCN